MTSQERLGKALLDMHKQNPQMSLANIHDLVINASHLDSSGNANHGKS